MIKKIFVILILTLFTTSSFSAGSDSTSSKVKSNYDKAVESIKFAKKDTSKGKLEKAKKRYEKAQKFFLKAKTKNSRFILNNYVSTRRRLYFSSSQ